MAGWTIAKSLMLALTVAFCTAPTALLAQSSDTTPQSFRMRLPRERKLAFPEDSQTVPDVPVQSVQTGPRQQKSCTECINQEQISQLYYRDSDKILFQATTTMSARQLVEAAAKSGVSFKNASFKNLHLAQVILKNQDLEGCDLTCAELGQASLEGCNFKKATISRTCFAQAHLEGATFDGVYIDKSKFGQARIQAATFNGCTIKDDDFVQATANNTQFKNCTFENTALGQLDGARSSFAGSQIAGSDFGQAKLTDADFKNVNCNNGKFGQAELAGADLTGTSFDHTNFVQTTINKNTLMPDTRYGNGLLRHHLSGLQIIKTR